MLRQAGHCHDVAGQHDDKSRARRYFNVSHGNGKILGRAGLCGIVGKAVLRFGNAHGERRETERGKALYLFFCLRRYGYSASAVNTFDYRLCFFFDAAVKLIRKVKIALFLITKPHDFFCKRFAAPAAVRPHGGEHCVNAERTTFFNYEFYFAIRVGRESVHSHNARESVNVFDIRNMAKKIRNTCGERVDVFFGKLLFLQDRRAF